MSEKDQPPYDAPKAEEIATDVPAATSAGTVQSPPQDSPAP